MNTRTFLSAEWRQLAMINYEIDPSLLAPFVPRGTEIDQWAGRTFVSMVGFRFLDTRLLGIPIPFHRDFDEINLRFYVRRWSGEEWRRGVVFIKEIVPRAAIATVARVVYNENYVTCRMRHRIDSASGVVEYSWRDSESWNRVHVRTVGAAQPLTRGSEAEFITEHYWGYAAQRDGGTVEYRVEHPPWRVWQVDEAHLKCDVARIYGAAFVTALRATPSSAFVAEGSPILVRRGARI
ncbi:MAG: DUF2071 domain-containing protein [Blastocatellia bacterium]|nr:DUF2071 domain-containing protein [Blastocatellia bacterium]